MMGCPPVAGTGGDSTDIAGQQRLECTPGRRRSLDRRADPRSPLHAPLGEVLDRTGMPGNRGVLLHLVLEGHALGLAMDRYEVVASLYERLDDVVGNLSAILAFATRMFCTTVTVLSF